MASPRQLYEYLERVRTQGADPDAPELDGVTADDVREIVLLAGDLAPLEVVDAAASLASALDGRISLPEVDLGREPEDLDVPTDLDVDLDLDLDFGGGAGDLGEDTFGDEHDEHDEPLPEWANVGDDSALAHEPVTEAGAGLPGPDHAVEPDAVDEDQDDGHVDDL